MLLPLRGSSKKHVRIDASDYSLVSKYKWYENSSGYAQTTFHRKGCSRTDTNRNVNVFLHKLILGEPPSKELHADHKNRNRLDNRRSNLRWGTRNQNAQNSKPRVGLKGVREDEARWSAILRGLYLGSFSSAKEAAMAYDKAARYFYGDFAYLNFPDDYYTEQVRYVDFVPDKKKLTSNYTGVSYFGHGGKRIKRWRAVYRKQTLGYFASEIEASEAYEDAKNAYKKSG